MVETNPFKIEEAKWTPKNVYEILPPNAISYTGYDYSEGSTDFDQEKTRESLLDGFFGFFGDLLGGIGAIIGGAINIGGAILSPIINGIGNLIGGIANAIGSIFGGGPSTSPPPPLFNPIKTNLEAAIQPHLDQIEESKAAIEAARAEQLVIEGKIQEQGVITDEALGRARESIAEARAAKEAADEAIGKADAAVVKLEEYNTALKEEIRVEFHKATSTAEAAIAEAEAANVELGIIRGNMETGLASANSAIDEAKTLTAQVKALAEKNEKDLLQATAKAEQGIAEAEAANAELVTMNTKLGTITEQSEALNVKLGEHNQKFTDGLATANSAIDEAKSLTAQVKAVAEQNKADVAKALADSAKSIADIKTINTSLGTINSEIGAINNKTAELTTAQANINAELTAINGDIAPLSGRITDLNTELNQKTQALESGLGDANEAISAANTLAQQVKSIADQNKADVASAISKADKANADLSTLTPKVTKAQTDVTKALADIGTANTNIEKAQADATKAFNEAGKVRNEVNPKIEAAQTKGTEALAVADKAVDWLKNPNEIGASLIAVNPETERPYYADDLELVTDNPPGTSGPTYMRPKDRSGNVSYGPNVPVDTKIKYTVSFWARADEPGSKIYGQFRTQEGRNVAPDGTSMSSGAINVSNPPQPSNKDENGKYVHGAAKNSYFIQDLGLPTSWTYYEHEIEFLAGVTSVSISIIYWNHSRGVATNQYISGLDIRPQIPTQASVDQAQNDAIRANNELLVQQEAINAAQGTINAHAEIFRDNQNKWNRAASNAIDALNKFNDNQLKWNTGAETAIEANTAAIKALNAPKGGSSVVPMIPGTATPTWTDGMAEIDKGANTADTGLPEGITKYYRAASGIVPAGGSATVVNSYSNEVLVDHNLEYEISWWVRCSAGSPRYAYVTLRNPFKGTRIVEKAKDGAASSNTWGTPVRAIITPVTTEWTKQTSRFKFVEGTTSFFINDIQFNNSTNDSNTYMYFADLQIAPKIPNQADVDEAQNKAIESHSLLFAEQAGWNATQEKLNKTTEDFVKLQTEFNTKQTGWNTLQGQINTANSNFQALQSNFNTKQIEWNAGATTAIEANTTAIKALNKLDIGESLIEYLTPTDAEVKAGTARYDIPVWTTGAHREMQPSSFTNPPPSFVKDIWGASSTQGLRAARRVPTKVRPGTKYIWSFWAYGSGKIVIYMYGNGESTPIKSNRQIKVNQTTYEEERDKDGKRVYDPAANGNTSSSTGTHWLLNGFKPDQLYRWTHYKFEVEFTPSTSEVWFQNFYWNWSEASVYGQYLADMKFYPDVPTQAQVDEAQNLAIKANADLLVEQQRINVEQKKINDLRIDFEAEQKKINDEQTGINAINTKTDASLLQGLKALGKKSMGASIIPYRIPTDDEVKAYSAGTLSYDPWNDPEYFEAAYTIPTNSTYGRYARAGAGDGTKSYEGTLVSVDNTIDYKIRFTGYAGTAGSILVVYMQDQDGGAAVESTSMRDQGTPGNTSYPIHYLTLKVGWHTYEGVIRFRPTTKAARLTTFYWNHPSGNSGTQCITGLEIVPEIPTQAQVDEAQDRALEAHDLLFDDLTGWQKTQESINVANTTASNGLLQGLKALGRKELGTSLVPFQVPTDAEVKARNEGNLDYDPWARPEYFKAGHRIGNTSKGYAPGATPTDGTQSFYGSYVDIVQGTDYKARFDTYAATSGSRIFWYLYDQDGNSAVEYTDFADSNGANSFINGLTLPSGWKTWEGKVRFKPGVRRVAFRQLFWNHPSGVATTQYLMNLEMVPDVPSQTEVDELQNEAIKKTTKVAGTNTDAIAALADAVESMRQVQLLDGYYREQQRILDEEQDTRASMLQEIQKTQNEMISRTIVKQGTSTFDDYIDITGSTVTAKNTWAGQIVITHVYNGNTYINRYPVPDVGKTKPREWSVSSYSVSAMRVDYWVYAGTPKSLAISQSGGYISGSSFSSGSWGRIYYRSSFPDNNGNTIFRYNINLRNADRPTRYETRILINGTVEFTKYWTGRGPMFPHENGADTLKVVWENPIPNGASVEIQGRTVSSTSSQAMVSSITGTIGYIEPSA